MLQEFCQNFQNSISGKYQGSSKGGKERPEGSKFREMLFSVYDGLQAQKTSDVYSDYDVKKAILLHEGDQLPGCIYYVLLTFRLPIDGRLLLLAAAAAAEAV